MLWGSIMADQPVSTIGYVNVDDVALAHVRAIERVEKSDCYLLSGPDYRWKDVLEILDSEYGSKVPFKRNDASAVTPFDTDTEKARRELGVEWKGLRETVKEVMDQQLGFLSS